MFLHPLVRSLTSVHSTHLALDHAQCTLESKVEYNIFGMHFTVKKTSFLGVLMSIASVKRIFVAPDNT